MKAESIEERLRRASSFNEDAERYDRARPTYPKELYDELWRIAELGPAPKTVEVGCGTGQASVALAERGAELTCVESGENMASIARRKLGGYSSSQVIVSKFENWDAGERLFDLVFAAACWHWVLQDIRYSKAASVLRSGGALAVVHSSHVYPEGFDPLFDSVQDVYARVTGSRHEVAVQNMPPPGEFDEKDREHIAEMDRVGQFELPVVFRILWPVEHSADSYIDLLSTFSDHWALERDARRALLEGIHKVISESPTGKITRHYLTTLRVARRK